MSRKLLPLSLFVSPKNMLVLKVSSSVRFLGCLTAPLLGGFQVFIRVEETLGVVEKPSAAPLQEVFCGI